MSTILEVSPKLSCLSIAAVQTKTTQISDAAFHSNLDSFGNMRVLKLKNLPNLRMYRGKFAWIDESSIEWRFPRLEKFVVQGNPYLDISRMHQIVERLSFSRIKAAMVHTQFSTESDMSHLRQNAVQLDFDSGDDEDQFSFNDSGINL